MISAETCTSTLALGELVVFLQANLVPLRESQSKSGLSKNITSTYDFRKVVCGSLRLQKVFHSF